MAASGLQFSRVDADSRSRPFRCASKSTIPAPLAMPLSEAEQWIAAQQAFWASRLHAIADLLTAEDAANGIPLPKE